MRVYPVVSSILRSCNQRLPLKMRCFLDGTDTLHSLPTGDFSIVRHATQLPGLNRGEYDVVGTTASARGSQSNMTTMPTNSTKKSDSVAMP